MTHEYKNMSDEELKELMERNREAIRDKKNKIKHIHGEIEQRHRENDKINAYIMDRNIGAYQPPQEKKERRRYTSIER